MYKLCKTEQSANRQRSLEQGLLQAMQIKHFDEISVSDLCAQLDVPRKAFYRYFDSKEGALHALLDHTLMAYESFPIIYSEGEKRTLVRELEQFFLFWIRQKSLLDALQRSSLSGALIERAIANAAAEAAVPKRFLQADEQQMQQHVTMFGICGLMSMVLQWHHAGYRESAHYMAEVAVRLLTQPLFPDAQKRL
jgi:AcrR family transcriptional regulator